ncbi:MAG: DsbA family protein [Hyphomicrobiales bacterium]|nr:DsbA family protein [Hyphomicrobiales bacterium]
MTKQFVSACRSAACLFVLAVTPLLAGCGGGPVPGAIAGDVANAGAVPTAGELAKTGPLEEYSLGKKDAPVTVIEYASLGCPICGHFHKTVFPRFKADYVDTGKVHYIFREFPIGASPTAAAQAVRCAGKEHYFKLNAAFMDRRGQWNARNPDNDLLYKIVQETGLSRTAFDSCMTNQEIQKGVNWVKLRGRELGVKGTPTFYINDDKIRGVLTYDEMKKIIDKHIANAANPA